MFTMIRKGINTMIRIDILKIIRARLPSRKIYIFMIQKNNRYMITNSGKSHRRYANSKN